MDFEGEEQPILQSKSSLREKRKQQADTTDVTPSDVPLKASKKPKKALTAKELEQRKKAAHSRVKKMAHAKAKKAFMDRILSMWEEDPEGMERRLPVTQEVVKEDLAQVPTPAGAELPKENPGYEENPKATFEDQAFTENETQRVVHNKPVSNYEYMKAHPLTYYQNISRNIYNPIRQAVVEQGIVLTPLPTFHRS